MSFKSVVLGTSARKSYTHDMSFDNNTTMEFGVLQPLMSQYMEPNARISVNTRQLVRLAPMPTPSFARLYLQNYARFVKMSDVVPYFESLLSKIPYSVGSKSYLPTTMPFTSNSFLQYYILCYSRYSVYVYDTSLKQFKLSTGFNSESLALLYRLVYNQPWHSKVTLDPQTNGFNNNGDNCITPLSSDYTVFLGSSTSDASTSKYMVCFRYTPFSMRIRKQLIGLGYGLSLWDKHRVSIAPLLAYYKSYFDVFGLTRDFAFEQSECYKIIRFVEDYQTDFSSGMLVSLPARYSVFLNFLSSLSSLYYCDANSYIAAQRSRLMNDTSVRDLTIPGIGTTNPQMGERGTLPFVTLDDNPHFFNLSIEALRRLSRFVSKDSVIGKRISDWVRVHYGASVSNSLFEQSFNLGSWRTNIDIEDVFNTSDTANIGNKDTGEQLGAYAGKGVGFSKNGFTFKSPSHGFCFVFGCIVPVAGLFQGNDPTLFALDLDTIPQPEFDALGYEYTPRSVFLSDNSIVNDRTPDRFTSTSFGAVPRYTGFKVKKNIVNGDMHRGFFNTDLHPYFLDRLIYNNYLVLKSISSADKPSQLKYTLSASFDNAPSASTEWQQLTKYPFMGDFNRLFYNSGSTEPMDTATPARDRATEYPVDDNFIVQSVFDVKLKNWMKPIQNSYDTVDETDNSTVNVTTN